ILYPIVSHWVWSPSGWLHKGISVTFSDGVVAQTRFLDFAGSGVVHLVGGTASIAAAAFLGPRLGRFASDRGPAEEIRGHSVPMVSLGAFVLLFGFLAFNGGSQGSISAPGDGQAVALAMVNTVLCGSSSAVVTLGIAKFRHKTWSLLSIINGALSGMVAICAGCNSIQPWGSLIIGVLASLSYTGWSSLILRLRIDDPLEAVGVHFGGGLLGVFVVPFLHSTRGILINPSRQSGLDLLWQLVGAAAIMCWSGGVAIIMFGSLKAAGLLRVCEDFERKGLDIPKHGEPAYPLVAYGHGWGDRECIFLELLTC
uniref:Ammonium_transp domain-containing protein n=1 Tax=Macrostomum lignano TaxID=282301 RepID=A0A1I8IXG0_9PLAT